MSMTQNSDTQIDEQVVKAIFSGLENGDGRAFFDHGSPKASIGV